jgi:flagellar protein FliS
MSHPARAAQQYLQTQVRSSSPLELVVLLYDGALRSSAVAIEAMERRDIPTRRNAITRTLAIVSELQSTLDMEKGGQIAEDLDRLYTWITDSLVRATVEQNAAPIHDVRKVLEIMRDGWHQIASGKAVPEPVA